MDLGPHFPEDDVDAATNESINLPISSCGCRRWRSCRRWCTETTKSTAINNLETHRPTMLDVATLSPFKSFLHRRCDRNGSLDILV